MQTALLALQFKKQGSLNHKADNAVCRSWLRIMMGCGLILP